MSPLPEDFSAIEDFLEHEAFRVWVMHGRSEDRVYWQSWLAQHPEKSELYEQAVAVFITLRGETDVLTDRQVDDKTQQILNRLPDVYTLTKPLFSWRQMAAAAVLMLVIGWQLVQFYRHQLPGRALQAKHQSGTNSWMLVKNFTGQPLVVLLPDNSSVLLTTGSQLRFRKRSDSKVREVFLNGEGFFEVTKNPAKPFIVYTTGLATKVFGTSFQVRSFDKEETAFVKVKTGKVTVAPIAAPEKAVFLTVNQSIRLNSATKQITKYKSISLGMDSSPITTEQFTFNYAPMPAVFDKLVSSYHMPIRYDREMLENCTFTGQLNDVPYLEKLRLICLTTESTFEIVENQVIIHSHGCK